MTNETAEQLREELVLKLSHLILRYDADGEERASIEGTADEFINKVLDAVISVAESERLTEETGDPSDTAYESAIDCVTLAINKLRP